MQDAILCDSDVVLNSCPQQSINSAAVESTSVHTLPPSLPTPALITGLTILARFFSHYQHAFTTAQLSLAMVGVGQLQM